MVQDNSVNLAVAQWSAWAPGLADHASWRDWAMGKRAIEGEGDPDVSFVKPLLRRRLSSLNRMAFHVAWRCLPEGTPPICIFCSRYGEYARAFEILTCLATEEPISPNTFSLSVHNTTSSLFSIMRQDRTHSTSVAAGAATLETGFLEAQSLLTETPEASALLVYYDEPLPALYEGHAAAIQVSAALGLLLRLPRPDAPAETTLRLSWQASGDNERQEKAAAHPVLRLARLLTEAGSEDKLDDGRLAWTWSRHVAAA